MKDPTSVYILIVNDREADLAALQAALSSMADTILTAQSARAALALVRQHDFAVAILDIQMPDVDGFELAAQLRAGDRTHDLPLLFVSAFDPTPERLDRIYSLGAVDFLQSPVNVKALRAKVAVFVDLFRKQRALELVASSVASQHEVTEGQLKDREAALRVSEEQFRVFFELAATGHVVLDPVTRRYLRVNARFCEIVGYSAEELLQMTYMDVTHPDEHEPDVGRFAGLLQGRMDEVSVEKRYLRKDGRVIWVNVTARLIRKPDGSPWLQLSVVQDITERKNADHALRESRSQLQLALEAAELGTYYFDQATGQTIWDDRTKKLLGYGPEITGSGELFFARVHPADRERVQQRWAAIHAVREQAFEDNAEFRVIWPDGSVHHLAAASRSVANTQPDGARTVRLVGTIRDVTAAKEFEQALQAKVAERTAALHEKTTQLESFCYTVAHDLRSPLRAISGYADIISQEVGDTLPADGLAYLDRIKASAARLDLLIKDLLAYSRIAQVDVAFDNVLLQPSIEWARQQLLGEIERKSATVEVAAQLPAVRADRSVLDQIFLNLMSNALKFVPAGRPPHVQISARVHDGVVRLAVRDNGIGITPAYHDRIFKVFERLKDAREYPGTGVGLAIVAKAAERLGGRVGVDSEPGQGSTFWVEMPAADSSARAA